MKHSTATWEKAMWQKHFRNSFFFSVHFIFHNNSVYVYVLFTLENLGVFFFFSTLVHGMYVVLRLLFRHFVVGWEGKEMKSDKWKTAKKVKRRERKRAWAVLFSLQKSKEKWTTLRALWVHQYNGVNNKINTLFEIAIAFKLFMHVLTDVCLCMGANVTPFLWCFHTLCMHIWFTFHTIPYTQTQAHAHEIQFIKTNANDGKDQVTTQIESEKCCAGLNVDRFYFSARTQSQKCIHVKEGGKKISAKCFHHITSFIVLQLSRGEEERETLRIYRWMEWTIASVGVNNGTKTVNQQIVNTPNSFSARHSIRCMCVFVLHWNSIFTCCK